MPTAISFAQDVVNGLPPWLQDIYGQAFATALGGVKDSLESRAEQSVLARLPLPTQALDTLTQIGNERLLTRAVDPTTGLSESLPSYANRLQNAWSALKLMGTPLGLLRALYALGYANPAIAIPNGYYYSLDANQNLVITSLPQTPGLGSWLISVPRFWSKFHVVFAAPNLPASWLLAAPAANDPAILAIRQVIQRWAPAFATCASIGIVRWGTTFGFPLGRHLFSVGFVPFWSAGLVVPANGQVLPNTDVGLIMQSVTGGTTGGAEPAWTRTVGATFVDNGCDWQALGPASPRWNPTPPSWLQLNVTALGALTLPQPGADNGHFYKATSIGAAPHITSLLPPTWPTVRGGTVVDGNITWTEYGVPNLTARYTP